MTMGTPTMTQKSDEKRLLSLPLVLPLLNAPCHWYPRPPSPRPIKQFIITSFHLVNRPESSFLSPQRSPQTLSLSASTPVRCQSSSSAKPATSGTSSNQQLVTSSISTYSAASYQPSAINQQLAADTHTRHKHAHAGDAGILIVIYTV